VPTEPLAVLTDRASQVLYDTHGLRIKLIEKPFHVTSRDDPAILEIIRGLALPLPANGEVPGRPLLASTASRPVRPTAQQMFRSKTSGAAAAARRAAVLERHAMEATARLGDALLAVRDMDAAALASARTQRIIADETSDEGDEGTPPPGLTPAAESSGAAETDSDVLVGGETSSEGEMSGDDASQAGEAYAMRALSIYGDSDAAGVGSGDEAESEIEQPRRGRGKQAGQAARRRVARARQRASREAAQPLLVDSSSDDGGDGTQPAS